MRVAKARELGRERERTILDDGGNLKAFQPDGWAPIPTIEMAQISYTALLASPRRTFSLLSRATRRFWPAVPTLARVAGWVEGFPIRWTEKLVGAIGERGAHKCTNDVPSCRERRRSCHRGKAPRHPEIARQFLRPLNGKTLHPTPPHAQAGDAGQKRRVALDKLKKSCWRR